MIRPKFDKAGTFMGFSTCINGEWTTPQNYRNLILAMRDKQSDVLCARANSLQQPVNDRRNYD